MFDTGNFFGGGGSLAPDIEVLELPAGSIVFASAAENTQLNTGAII